MKPSVYKYAFLFFVSLLLLSCSKTEEVSIPWQKSAVPGYMPLRSVSFISDSLGFCCGGEKGQGYVYKSTDGGKSWALNHRVDRRNLHGIYFTDRNTGWIAGDSLYLSYTKNGGKKWNFHWFADNVPTHEFNRPRLSDFYFVNDSVGFVCGGENFNRGIVYRTRDAGKNWAYDFYENELNAVCYRDEENGLLAGYGLMLQSSDSGATYELLDIDQQYFRGLTYEGRTAYAATYRGKIFKSWDEGKNWEMVLKTSFRISDMAANDDFMLVAGRDGGLMFKRKGSNEWLLAKDIPDVDYESVCLHGNYAWAVTLNGEVLRFSLK